MIHAYAENIADYLVENGASQDVAVLRYGAECFLNELLSSGVLLLIGLLTGSVWELIVWSLSFCSLRVQVGGIHAPTHGLCIFSGAIVGTLSLILSALLLKYAIYSLILTIGCLLTAILIAPVPHKNKMYLQKKRGKIKKNVAIIAAIESAVLAITYMEFPIISSFVMSGIIMATLLGAMGLIWNHSTHLFWAV